MLSKIKWNRLNTYYKKQNIQLNVQTKNIFIKKQGLKTLQIIDCMRVKFEYEILEVLTSGKRVVGIESHKVNGNARGGSRRRLLQNGGSES